MWRVAETAKCVREHFKVPSIRRDDVRLAIELQQAALGIIVVRVVDIKRKLKQPIEVSL